MKNELLSDINEGFVDVTSELLFVVATLLDPRYPGKLLTAGDLAAATGWLLKDAEGCQLQQPAADTADVLIPEENELPRKRHCKYVSPFFFFFSYACH